MEKTSLILILAFIFSFSFGSAAMDIDENGNMSDCPFADTAAICPMNFAEHISIFQSIFRSIPVRVVSLLILVFSSLLVLYSKSPATFYSPPIKLKIFVKNSLELPIFNKLLLALSDGIIQPKLYA